MGEMVRAAVYVGPRQIELREFPRPRTGPDDGLLRIEACGIWGGYAEYVYLHPNAILHPIRGDIPAEVAVMFNPLGAGVRWTSDLGGVKLGDTVLILGAGQRGLASVIVARAAGAGTIIVTGLSRDH